MNIKIINYYIHSIKQVMSTKHGATVIFFVVVVIIIIIIITATNIITAVILLLQPLVFSSATLHVTVALHCVLNVLLMDCNVFRIIMYTFFFVSSLSWLCPCLGLLRLSACSCAIFVTGHKAGE
jgi:hypothetical protein